MLPPGSVRPDYDGYCLSNVSSTALSLLGLKGPGRHLPDDALGSAEVSEVENVVLMLFDGLGYAEWKRQETHGFLGALSGRGSVSPITTVFPSTTAAALTSVSTGLTPQEHGLPEWYVYMQEVGEVIVTLPFSRVGDSRRDTLRGVMDPNALFDGKTMFERLKDAGMKGTSLTTRSLAHSAFSEAVSRGGTIVPCASSSDLAVSLRRLVENSRGQNVYYVYWPYVDTLEHIYGPGTDEAGVEASLISHALLEGFLSKLSPDAAKKTFILATADHGQLRVAPEETLYMNGFRKLVNALDTDPSGRTIPPWGSARDLYMRVRGDRLRDVESYLAQKLVGIASVLETEDAVKQGLFGLNEPSRKFLRRVGNLMVLPHDAKTVWFRYRKGDSLALKGHHGGLTEDEMTIPLASGRASDLQR
jgi:hypothetical protein